MDSRTQAPELRAAILSVALEQIAKHGYDAVRLRDIAAAAGVSIGLLQHHFGSRAELLGQAFEHHCAATLEEWEGVWRADLDPWEQLVAVVDRVAAAPALPDRAAIWAEFCAISARRPELRTHLRRIYVGWRGLMADAITTGVEQRMFAPTLAIDEIVDLLIAEIDGPLLAIAGDVGQIDGARLRHLVLSSAGALLGRAKTDSRADHDPAQDERGSIAVAPSPVRSVR